MKKSLRLFPRCGAVRMMMPLLCLTGLVMGRLLRLLIKGLSFCSASAGSFLGARRFLVFGSRFWFWFCGLGFCSLRGLCFVCYPKVCWFLLAFLSVCLW